MNEQLKKVANQIATELVEMPSLDIDNLKLSIQVKIKEMIISLMDENTTKEELLYLDLMEKQHKAKYGTKQYFDITHKMTMQKYKKAKANRAANNIRKQICYDTLRWWVINNYGEESFTKYLNEPKNN